MTEEAALAFVELNRERAICVSYWVDSKGNLEHATLLSRSLARPRTTQAFAVAALAAACNTAPSASDAPDPVETALGAECTSPDEGSTPAKSSVADGTTEKEQIADPVEDTRLRIMGAWRGHYEGRQKNANDRDKRTCATPWVMGADGIRRIRPECL
jgi:hypothetical protein